MALNIYWKDLQECIPRLITLVDRNPLSKSSGSFSRGYWHFKTADFPPAIHQIGLAVLAKLLTNKRFNNYTDEYILKIIENGIHFTAKIQKNDGTFDEWYFNERGWAGPTGYILNALCDIHSNINQRLNIETQNILRNIISKAAIALTNTNEKHVLANHIAIAVLPLSQAYDILKDERLKVAAKRFWRDFIEVWQDDEGWSLEYDGSDPGYQSATVAFLMKCPNKEWFADIEKVIEGSTNFVSYFCYPDGTFGGHIGSRHTTTLFPSGIELQNTPLSNRITAWIDEAHLYNGIPCPQHMDDHYFLYRCNEWCDSAIARDKHHSNTENNAKLPYENELLEHLFEKAGIGLKKIQDLYVVSSLSRGGAIKIFSCEKKTCIHDDAGILLESDKQLWSSLWQGDYTTSLESKKWSCTGKLHKTNPKYFSPMKFILFRIFFMITGFHHKSALMLKNLIRSQLMVHVKPGPYEFSRVITFNDKSIEIKTTCNTHNNQVIIGGDFSTRYVPQSSYGVTGNSTISSFSTIAANELAKSHVVSIPIKGHL